MENKRPKLHLRHASITCQRARLQIWCDRDLSLESGGQPLSYIPKAQLAIITAEQLILIKGLLFLIYSSSQIIELFYSCQ